jgi:hypothetical protein
MGLSLMRASSEKSILTFLSSHELVVIVKHGGSSTSIRPSTRALSYSIYT